MQLPEHLLERTRWHPYSASHSLKQGGQFVLYWMQTAMRLNENPALDVAVELARQAGLPLLIYQGLSTRYRYASDRHHTFILQGARDVQAACQEHGLSYALYVEQAERRQPLAELMQRARAVIVEDMPTDPHRLFVRAAARHNNSPIIAVDTACVVPMRLVGRAYQRAFDYRNDTRVLYKSRVNRDWPALEYTPIAYDMETLPWQPPQLNSISIADLIGGCDIDHTIAPVTDTVGGTQAGMARWETFKLKKIRLYAADRNEPLKQPSSRLSAYLHYGMISPMRIAREASALGNEGAIKFLDELLIWRELAYAFCFYRQDHARWSALPDWARETLQAHANDQRSHDYNWETLARAATHDRLWNAAQYSLLRHGELHNNLRMTWGKAFLNWCRTPPASLRLAIDLNHRYALDGRDPASYGGLLWCFGQFDRPFAPSQRVFGTVRTRPTSEHLRRLNVEALEQQLHSPTVKKQLQHQSGKLEQRQRSVAIIGAGMAGCIAARTLSDLGIDVQVFEKSHGPGGRMSTRHAAHADFDHGAQYFTCRDERFGRYVESWLQRGVVARWEQPIAVYADGVQCGISHTERYVAVPGMNALGKYLVRGLNVHLGVRIAALTALDGRWQLMDEHGDVQGDFDSVIIALPAAQAHQLLAEVCPSMAQSLSQYQLAPCWAVMANLAEPLAVQWGGAFINSGPVRWLARNQTKPGRREQVESLVIHASAQWSGQHMDWSPEQVCHELLQATSAALGMALSKATFTTAHRWRYALPVSERSLLERAIVSPDQSLIACGDWASGARIEGAFLSGAAAAGYVLRR